MVWLIVIGIGIWIVVSVAKNNKTSAAMQHKLNFELMPIMATKLQELNREEFPAIADLFTKTTIMSALDGGLEFLKREVGANDFFGVVQKMQSMPLERQKTLEEQSNQVTFDAYPPAIRDHISSMDGGYERFIKISEAAAALSFAE